ncbi:uncharacterized protein LOC125306249 isoform X1 [Alosa alosa]|uniref:uncharacterized protein LOC121721323 n=1 Tax=Alosa sapidissima TaxID=34773 RepID=UPI001C08BDAC|nr:uncharacterized protein LOC121721323 [Alosa sapidissima]XP_048117463.1 uncharacterized protein LOC125306249 isoform X1 [Alosa alosa]
MCRCGYACSFENMLSVDTLIILIISTASVFAVGWHNPSPIIFGRIGHNVTLNTHVKASGSSTFTWYRQKLSGEIEMIHSASCENKLHYTVGMSDGIGFMTIYNTLVTDSGSYFAVSRARKTKAFLGTSYVNLAVTDHTPLIRLFYGSGIAKTHVFQCEIVGARADWSNPYWEITENGHVRKMKGVGSGGIDADGRFTRWSVVTLSSDKSFSLTCLSSHNHTTNMIKTGTIDMSKGASVCVFTYFLITLACVLILLTMVLTVLSAWRIRQRRLERDG